MISSNVSTRPRVMVAGEVFQGVLSQTSKPRRQKMSSLHYMTWICLLLACLGASWFSYQYFLVPQPRSFAPDWHGAQWVQAADGSAPVAYFRYVSNLNTLPDAAFVTVAASQEFSIYVNGSAVGTNALDFGRGNFPRTYMYDVTSLLQLGSNMVAVRVVNADEHIPCVRMSIGIVHGKSIFYRGTGEGWQATAQPTLVYPHFAKSLNVATIWTTNTFDASSWLPVQKATNPASPTTLTVNPLVYEQPISTRWMSAGSSHEAYFVSQISLSPDTTGIWLRVVAIGTADVFINNQLFIVWNGQALAPPADLAHYLSTTAKTTRYQSGLALGVYDVSTYLHPGKNIIAVHVVAPGNSAALNGLGSLNASIALDMLIDDAQGRPTWLTPGAGWHASSRYVEGWAEGSDALAWPLPISVTRPGPSHLFYIPDSYTPRSVQVIPLSLLCEVFLVSAGAILGLWLLMSLFIIRCYHLPLGHALETMSLAYLPALAFEGLLVVLSREPQIPQPFPYTEFWGMVLILLVVSGYFLLWLNARIVPKRHLATSSDSSKKSFIPLTIIAPFHESFLKLYHVHPKAKISSQHKGILYLRRRILPWIGIHWALIPIVLLAIPLICYNPTYEPYWQDELTSYFAAKNILAHGIPELASGYIYAKGELYSYMLALSMLIFGQQGSMLRIISIVEYLVSLPLFYSVGSYFFNRRVALLATAMFAFSPITLGWGREVRMYEQAQLLTILVVYMFYKALQEPEHVYLVYLAVACLVADYVSHEEAFITFPALVLWVVVIHRDEKRQVFTVLRQKHWWIAGILGASIIALQLLIAFGTHPPILGTDSSQRPFIQLTTDNIPYYGRLLFFPWLLSHLSLGRVPLITLNSMLAVIGCFWAMRRADGRAKYCAWFLVTSFFTLTLLFTLESDRYFYPLIPIYYLMGAHAMFIILRAIWAFAQSRAMLQQVGQTSMPIVNNSLSKPIGVMMVFITSIICAFVLILPVLPIADYNTFVSQQVGFAYRRHEPDYDAVGQYVQHHWRKGDIVISLSPAISVLYYVGRVDYFFTVDHALYLFERDGGITDTPTGSVPLLSQNDFETVLATHQRIWIISAGEYQNQTRVRSNGRFIFPPDFHLVYEGYDTAVYLRGG